MITARVGGMVDATPPNAVAAPPTAVPITERMTQAF